MNILDAMTSRRLGKPRIWFTSLREVNSGKGKRRMMDSDVVIANGIILKNRQGRPGKFIGRAAYVWEEESFPQNSLAPVQ